MGLLDPKWAMQLGQSQTQLMGGKKNERRGLEGDYKEWRNPSRGGDGGRLVECPFEGKVDKLRLIKGTILEELNDILEKFPP